MVEENSRLLEIEARLSAGKLEQGVHYQADVRYLLDMLNAFQGDIGRLQSEAAVQARAFLALNAVRQIHEILNQAGFCPQPMA